MHKIFYTISSILLYTHETLSKYTSLKMSYVLMYNLIHTIFTKFLTVLPQKDKEREKKKKNYLILRYMYITEKSV